MRTSKYIVHTSYVQANLFPLFLSFFPSALEQCSAAPSRISSILVPQVDFSSSSRPLVSIYSIHPYGLYCMVKYLQPFDIKPCDALSCFCFSFAGTTFGFGANKPPTGGFGATPSFTGGATQQPAMGMTPTFGGQTGLGGFGQQPASTGIRFLN